jgi:hypothetical protein
VENYLDEVSREAASCRRQLERARNEARTKGAERRGKKKKPWL